MAIEHASAPSTPEQRREAIRRGLEDLAPIIIEAYRCRDWEHFGFASWSDYLADFGQLRLPRPERQAAVLEMRQSGMSQRAIGEALGVSHETVRSDIELSDSGQLPARITGLDGKERPASVPHVSQNSGENEWYTPVHIIDAARRAMGSIDLDPASSYEANRTVQAEAIFTRGEDGLSQQWHGTVWLNPPYSSDLVSRFADKLIDEYVADRVEQACFLSNNATETKWFQRLARVAGAICFPEGRISYWHPDRTSKTPLQGQAILYCGARLDEFAASLNSLGLVVRT